jgi:hypothetical protein
MQFDIESVVKGASYVISDENKTHGKIGKNIYFLAIFEQHAMSRCCNYRLVVTTAEGRGRGHFRRLGMFNISFHITCYRELITLLSNQTNALMNKSMYEKNSQIGQDWHKPICYHSYPKL